ncbi:MAG TPA: RluA family pseudouridine synthase [Blastocatellia bacterium]|nr:RluA family pseudouridine synthase [Blastocatellia bacterium]
MSRSYTFKITSEEAGQRLDEFLASRFGGLSRMRIAGLLGRGAGRVASGPGLPGYRLAPGDMVEFLIDEPASSAMRPEPVPLEIIHEDDHILVVVKPSGMLVHPTKSVKSGTLANALTYHLNRAFYDDPASRAVLEAGDEAPGLARPGLVHRLDRATSGLMVIAVTPRALSVLSRHFHRRLVEKRYLAVVRGGGLGQAGVIRAPIGRDPDRRPQWGVMESGRPSETRFRVLSEGPGATLVELEPVTGRTNQLRIHLAHAGHPVIGDELYGPGAGDQGSEPGLRLCLHAWRLAFHHPSGGEWMEFTSPLPRDMEEASEEMAGAPGQLAPGPRPLLL